MFLKFCKEEQDVSEIPSSIGYLNKQFTGLEFPNTVINLKGDYRILGNKTR
jgi:hypothetical protein